MDSVRSGNICRRFINGSCRFGRRCKYRHEFTPIPASQICRYFQKGGCWYGERCRFFHVLLPQAGPVFPGRRGSMPVASPSGMPHYSERRGSEPTLWRVNVPSRQRCSGSQSAIYPFNLQQETGNLPEYVLEELSQENYLESAPSSGIAQASAWQGRYERASKSEMCEDGAAAACNEKSEETLAFLQSKNVVCGICMDKVYEKENQRDRVFGILPNCNHPFCLDCIATWRKTKDIGLDVVRACPQCRVRSAFYVPNKYWVEGQEKENVIGAFKKKFGKKRCCFYDRYGCCPFKKECLYRHVGDSSNSPVFSYLSEEEDDSFTDLLGFFISMSLLGGEEADEELLFCLTEDYGF
ncbi:makorin, ring finger protein, 4 [Gambusia affinis]|nr:makorin, ring finger protein, 4 [Gambusia affinis]